MSESETKSITELVQLVKTTALQESNRPRLFLLLGTEPAEDEIKILTRLDCKKYQVQFQPVSDNNKIWWSNNNGHIAVILQYLEKCLKHSNFILTEIEVIAGVNLFL